MKHSPILRKSIKVLSLCLPVVILLTAVNPVRAALYQVGDVVTNFTFVARQEFTRPDGTVVPAGATVHIQDFAGQIVFLEWFAVWCPFCQAAVPQVKTGIVDYYASRGGNPYGVPVLHVAVNQESSSFYQASTDDFITNQDFHITLNDYIGAGSSFRIKPLFQPYGQPVFVAINCLTNSPTHQPWQVLVNYLGYGHTDFSQQLADFRAAIDQVQPAPMPLEVTQPQVLDNGGFEFTVQAPAGENYQVQYSSDLNFWTNLVTVSNANSTLLIRDTNAPPTTRFYRVVAP